MPVGQARQAVVERDVLQSGLRAAARRHVLNLQDQAGRVGADFGEQAAVDRCPDFRLGGLTQTQLGGEGCRVAGLQALHEGEQAGLVAGVDELAQRARFEFARVLEAEQIAQRVIGLQDAGVEAHQGHPDRRVRERAVEALLAGAQLEHMGGGELGLALGGDQPARACGFVGLLLAGVVVQGEQQQSDDRCGGHQHPDAGLAEAHGEQVGDRGAGRGGDADPAEVSEQAGGRGPFAALEMEHGRDQQRVEHEIEHRAGHRGDQHPSGVGQTSRAHGAQDRGQRRADAEHGNACHRRARQAACPALGAATGAEEGIGGGGQRGSLGTVQQQQQEDEDFASREGILPARDAHREHRGQHRHRRAGQHDGQIGRRQGQDRAQHMDQDAAPEQQRQPPVDRSLAVVVRHQRTVQARPPGRGQCRVVGFVLRRVHHVGLSQASPTRDDSSAVTVLGACTGADDSSSKASTCSTDCGRASKKPWA